MPVIKLRLGPNHSPTQSFFWKLWMLSQQAKKLLADAAGWLPDWSWLFPSEIYVAIVSWSFQTIFTSSDRLQMPSRMRTFANHGTQCVFPAPKHLQSPAISQTCTRWKGQRLCKDAQNRQNTAPNWNSGSFIHFFNCEHLELHFECYLGLLALHWFNKRWCGYASQAHWHQILSKQVQRSSAGIWHDISSNESYQRESLTENGSRLQRTNSVPK